jgi:Cu2+-exporting ATPase
MTQTSVQLQPPPSQVSLTTAPKKQRKFTLVDRHQLEHDRIPAVAYTVVHLLPERVRLRVPRLRYDDGYARRLQFLLNADTLITSSRINRSAASLIVTFKASSIAKAKMHSRLVSLIQAASTVISSADTRNATLALHTSQEQAQTEEIDSASTWQFSALATIFAVGGSLGLPIPPLIVAGSIAAATLPVAKRALAGMTQERKLNIDLLDFMAIAITTVQGQFLTPALMLGLIEIGEQIRDRTARSNQLQTLDLLSCLGQFVWVERHGEKQQIPTHDVQRGDTVIVYPGEQVPVDGTILRGKALLDEQKLTGESMPVLKRKGQPVYASTLLREGRIYIQAERIGSDTRAGQSIKLIQAAPVHDTRMENYAAKIAEKAVIPTILLGSVVFAATRNPARAAAVLTLDFATGIRVSIPTTVLAALTYAAKRGILIRSGRALELLAEIDTVVFDKTGTLTQGQVAIASIESLDPATSKARLLQLAAAAEQRLTHPVAEAIIRHAQAQQIEIPPRGKWTYQLGLGVTAEIDGETVLVGSRRFLQQAGIELKLLDKSEVGNQNLPLPTTNNTQHSTNSSIYIASDGILRGVIHYRDLPRPESRDAIATLSTVEGVEVHMLTGDNWRTARAVAAELGIQQSNTHAEAFPEQKAAVIRQLHERGKTVAFVGDGLNDSPALAYADVSVSFANGSDIARETADVVLMQDNLQGLIEAIAIARQAKQAIGQNTNIIVAPNLVAMVLAVFFGISPLAATVVNNGSTVVAGVNGLRPILKRGVGSRE